MRSGILVLVAACFAGSAAAQPRMLRDANGAPVLLYGKGADAMVVKQEGSATEPVVVVKDPAVRDSGGKAVTAGGAAVKSVSAAPMTERSIGVYEVDRYLLVPSASTGASSSPSTVIVPAPRPIDPSTE